jgi:hypothetical protein
MADLAKYVQWAWQLSVAAQIVVCVVLFLKGNFRKLPIFTAYVLSNILQAAALYVIYRQFGLDSQFALRFSWVSEAATLLLRVFATMEVLRLILKHYRGIWGLGWRVLAVAFGSIFLVALIDSGLNVTWAILLADRGFHLAFATALVACLLLIHFYSVPIHPVHKALLGGFCFYSCTVVLANTVGGTLFQRRDENFETIWQLTTMTAFVGVLLVWAVALRKPLQESAPQVAPREAQVAYWEMSPQINERLRLLNEQLNRLWRPEVTRH